MPSLNLPTVISYKKTFKRQNELKQSIIGTIWQINQLVLLFKIHFYFKVCNNYLTSIIRTNSVKKYTQTVIFLNFFTFVIFLFICVTILAQNMCMYILVTWNIKLFIKHNLKLNAIFFLSHTSILSYWFLSKTEIFQ